MAGNELRTAQAVHKGAFVDDEKDGVFGLSGIWQSLLLKCATGFTHEGSP